MNEVVPGVPAKQILKWVLPLMHEWTDLITCMIDETGDMLDTLLEYILHMWREKMARRH